MLKTVDVGLMANHLTAHEAIIKRLHLYLAHCNNSQISTILSKQIGTMTNHVQVMNQLLDPKQSTVTLPPIPNGTPQPASRQNGMDLGVSEKDMVMDAHYTATSMAKENFFSSESMKDFQVKKIHSEMALQQSAIAEMYDKVMKQMEWDNHPSASDSDRIAAITPLQISASQAFTNNQSSDQLQ